MVDVSFAAADMDFQGKHPDERFQFYFHQHWIRMVVPLLSMLGQSSVIAVIVVFIAAVTPIDDQLGRHALLLFLALAFLAVQLRFLMKLYIYFLYAVIVTDRRVHRIKKTLFSVDDHQSIDLWTFQDIMKNQHGIVQNIFGYGSLTLEAQDTQLRLHFVPRIAAIHQKLSYLCEQARPRTVSSR